MKRIVSLLLATLMIVALVPAFGMAVAAEESNTSAETTYVAYSENFDDLDVKSSSDEILRALGWYVPDGKADENIAKYSAVASGSGKALRVSTETFGIGFGNNESFVTVFSSDLMDVVRNGDFELSYDLTYRAGTTNANGYSAMIYNYNEKGGESVVVGDAAAYGIVAVRACGAGFNNIYYPISGGSTTVLVEGTQNKDRFVMSNRYSTAYTGANEEIKSLYSRLIEGNAIVDEDYVETADTILQGTVRMIDKTLHIVLQYDFDAGMRVYINDVLVSAPNMTDEASDYANTGIWNQFIDRTTGSSIGLVTKADVVADIDNIEVLAYKAIGDQAYGEGLPELVITELNPIGINPTGATNYTWAEYVEIYNPTNKAINLADYSFMVAPVVSGGADDMTIASNHIKFRWSQDLGELFGQKIVSATKRYVSYSELETFDKNANRFVFVDPDTDMTKGARYRLDGTNYVRDDENGGFCYIQYAEVWNEKYNVTTTNYNDRYNSNTWLKAGECALIYTINEGSVECYKYGVNNGSKNIDTYGSLSFRAYYSGYGLSKGTKILAMNAFNLHDNPTSWSNANVRYYIGKSCDDAGNKIEYTKHYINDANVDPYLVSWCDWNSSVDLGSSYEGIDVNNADFGKAGQTPDANTEPCTAVYVYGVDASSDRRAGTRYRSNNPITNGHTGRLAGYQEIIMKDLYKPSDNTMADVSITEIVARTNNLVGEAYNAFSAMELTNTSGSPLNLYRYALVRTRGSMYPRDSDGKLVSIGRNDGFSYSTILKAGNPVTLGERNGAYYHFINGTISNPETCILQPGESAVVWFITSDTYQSYSRDDDFNADYFRQYWVNQGVNQLALMNADGEYATKVIAVDANTSKVTNFDNASRVFDVDATHSAVYGVANASYDVKKGIIKDRDVISFAFLGACATYYKLEKTEIVTGTGTYYANVLTRTIPVNRSVRYIVGGAGNNKASAMTASMKIQYWTYSGSVWYSNDPGYTPVINITNSDGTVEPRLGTLDGEELNAVRDTLLVSEKAENGDITYRYFDAMRTGLTTAGGAAISTNGAAQMRFDNVINGKIYSSLTATYGQNVQVGMLIVDSSLLGDKTVFTKADLDSSGITYQDVNCSLLYRTGEYAVLGATVDIDQANYGTAYTAIGYMTVKLHDGTVKQFYSTVSTTRSLAEVAESALEDVSAVATDVYNVQNSDGTFGRYSTSVQELLRGYVGQ